MVLYDRQIGSGSFDPNKSANMQQVKSPSMQPTQSGLPTPPPTFNAPPPQSQTAPQRVPDPGFPAAPPVPIQRQLTPAVVPVQRNTIPSYGQDYLPNMPLPSRPLQQQGLEQQALAGGSNAQQTQNFLRALKGVGAGSNNTFMNGGMPIQAQNGNLLDNVARSNGDYGSTYMVNNNQAGGANPLLRDYNYQAPIDPTKPRMEKQIPISQMIGNSSMTAIKDAIAAREAQTPKDQANFAANYDPYKSNVIRSYFGTPTTSGPEVTAPTQNDVAGSLGNGSNGWFGGVMAGLGSLGQLISDENAKTNIEPGNRGVKDFLNTIKAHSYEYKDKADGPGRYVSPMAQELEKTELGKSAVIANADGKKMVDYARLAGVNLAAAAMLNKRVNELEKKIKLSKKRK